MSWAPLIIPGGAGVYMLPLREYMWRKIYGVKASYINPLWFNYVIMLSFRVVQSLLLTRSFHNLAQQR